ncbi:MAG: SDR family NAD(P)-dependent oxidoreductase [Comamonadaceae bacterium]|nr:MAG: SDR family NAD(P)-dependent oxidoreductase [Comamonadaceae bacterium]
MTDRLQDAVVLLSGAGGGIGSALTEALLAAGVAEIISAGRDHPPAHARVRQETVDITDLAAVQALAQRCGGRVTVVIACAGVNANQRLFTPGFEAAARREVEVNYFGLINLASAFAPPMQSRGSGLFVHLLTVLSHVNLPLMAGYCASKAAADSITQALRAELGRSGVQVCGVYPAVVDTAMSRDIPGPKLAPAELAQAIVQAIEDGDEDVYPGPAAAVYQQVVADPKAAERRMAARLP